MKRRVLLIDDQSIVHESFAHLLNQSGNDCISAENAETGIALFHSALTQPESRFDLVVCNVGLKGKLTGFDVCTAIRKEDSDVKVWLYSAQMGEDRKQEAQSVGADYSLLTGDVWFMLQEKGYAKQTRYGHWRLAQMNEPVTQE